MEETRLAPYSGGEDKISSLPDSLIHYILSFIDTKYAVQTCVLSKRWIDIWKSLPYLNFDRNSFSEDKYHSFIMFVDMVFVFHKDFDIQKLSVLWIKCSYDTTVMMNVNRWIIQAVKYSVQDIGIVITQCHDSPYEIPPHLLNCKSLRKLSMQVEGKGKYTDIILPGSMNLPQLKLLILDGLSISNVESSKRLFSSCPVLETLHLVDCDIQTNNQRNLIIDSLSLKTFAYVHCRRKHLRQNGTMANIIKLSAPNLEFFTCTSFMTQEYYLENCSPLYSVGFGMRLRSKEEQDKAEAYSKLSSEVYATRAIKFLKAVYMVKAIRLSPGFLEVLSRAPDLLDCQPPRLWNLEYLAMDMWYTRGCLRAIAYLLSISPNIAEIYLELKESNLADVGDCWEAGLSPPGMLSRLEYVEIQRVDGCDNELKFLSFLLKNAKVLKDLVLCPCSTIASPDRVREQLQDKLRALPRASSHIKMHWPATDSIDLI